MVALLAFAGILLLAVLVSDRAHRSVLSTAVLFLAGGFALGDGVLGAIHIDPGDELVGSSPNWRSSPCPSPMG